MKKLLGVLAVSLLARVACFAGPLGGGLGGGSGTGLNGAGGNASSDVLVNGSFSTANSGLILDSQQTNGSVVGFVDVFCGDERNQQVPLMVTDSSHIGFSISFTRANPTGQRGCDNGSEVGYNFYNVPVKFRSPSGVTTQYLGGFISSVINYKTMGNSWFNVSYGVNNAPMAVNMYGHIYQIGGWKQ